MAGSEMQRGRFITIEGSEGAGKSSCLRKISALLQQLSIEHRITREPGGTELAEAIRDLLLRPWAEPVQPLTELLLLFAGRAQHIQQLIEPALAAGIWVVSDRFTDATYAYQGGGRAVPQSMIAQLEQLVQGELRPDLTLFLDLPVADGLRRIDGRDGELDRFEREQIDFFERIRACYLARSAAEPERVRRIDASAPLDQVTAAIEQTLRQAIQRWSAP